MKTTHQDLSHAIKSLFGISVGRENDWMKFSILIDSPLHCNLQMVLKVIKYQYCKMFSIGKD